MKLREPSTGVRPRQVGVEPRCPGISLGQRLDIPQMG
jgi:hypothetical protein